MCKNELKKWLGVVGRKLLAYALVFAPGAWATQNLGIKDQSASPKKAAAQQASETQSAVATLSVAQGKQAPARSEEPQSALPEEKSSGNASHQGIKVHGHWTIEVKTPGGSLVRHVEFENSIAQTTANQMLSQILARQSSVGLWFIYLAGSAGGPCVLAGNGNQNCIIVEPNGSLPSNTEFFTNLAVSVSSNNHFVLSGQATAAVNDSIFNVSTWLATCAPTVAPASCGNVLGNLPLTSTSASTNDPGFSAPIPVQAGQMIAVTVVISFS